MGKGAWRAWRTGRRIAPLIASLFVAATAVAAQDTCEPGTVILKGDWGAARFSVEVADDDSERAQGLMNREELALGAGMYFVYDRPRRASFWMRNTLIPLDVLFIDPQGVVRHIHHEAVPLDETPIDGGRGILTVLEINGGLARRLGITEGSLVRHPAHAAWDPAWPC
ncbi:DUF192 domain-containing protein [Marimonas sp. MJW-29]|uniref:DUF192 domain-containing protein n=1 Tax=Sulfitobacter sediminis TaxID=3234186 RepID=A0ABV3RP65_9RHOB